jgi:predicted nucleotide-binding protein
MAVSVKRLQHDVTDPTISVGTILQKAILVANGHKDQCFLDWARRELNGHSTAQPDAEYRNLKGQYVVITSDGRTLPIVLDKDDPTLKARFLTLPLAEIEALLSGGGNTFTVTVNVDPRSLTKIELEPADRIGFSVTRATLSGFLHAVRQRVLDWTMTLTVPPQRPQQIRRSILQVIDRLQVNSRSYPDDSAIAAELKISVEEVRGHLGILEREGRIKLNKTMWGHSAGLDPTQRQLLRESAMATTPLERLTTLKQELQDLAAEPWSNVEAWIAKTTPVMRRDWPDHFDDFLKAAKTPQWTALPFAFGGFRRDAAEDQATFARTNAIDAASNRAIANSAKDKLLKFLEGLITIAEPPVTAPKKRERAGDKSASKNRNASKLQRQLPRQEGSIMAEKQADLGVDTRKVFVVHGRNNPAREALFTFLRAIGLHPLEWSEIVKATGKASPYIGEVLEKGFSIAQAVVVLMTPDDEARLREPYRGSAEPPHETELTPQPRPNVLLEGGMALGLFPERTVIVELGRLRPLSDIGGRHVIRMNDTPERRQDLAQRLETAGCAVNRSGTDWYSAGAFSAATAASASTPKA